MNEWTGMIPNPCKEVCLVAGQNMYEGTVKVAKVSEGLIVTYSITEENIYLEEVHLDIFKTEDEFKNAKKISNGGAIPGKFEYKESWSSDQMITSHSVLVPNDYINETLDGSNCLYIASHAALSNGETAWGGLCDSDGNSIVNLDEANQFPGANWSVYFQFCMEECSESKDFTYAWEDLQNIDNDGDYNDLVIKSNLIKSNDELKIKFFASARGAAFDHSFKIRIPKKGITNVLNSASYVEDSDDADYYFITIFESTKAVLPAEGYTPSYVSNTAPDDPSCTPNAERTITLKIDSDFVFNQNIPYEPLITVFPFGSFGTSPYDLYIYEISGRDTWKNEDDIEYPNGIIIPSDWKWPLEYKFIDLAYPDFKSITEGWNPNWADNLGDSSQVFTCN